jgi:FkbM family methyltransferase
MLRRLLLKALPSVLKDRVKRYMRSVVGPEVVCAEYGLDHALSRVDPSISTIFDIGANVGDLTFIMLDLFPNATVFAFEPCASTFQQLRERTEASPVRDRVRLFNHGFYDEPCSRALHVTSHHGANSMLEITPEYREMNPHIRDLATEDIRLVRLDDFVAEHGVTHIDLMKIDVEGAEYEVLAGGRHTLESSVDTVFCEISFVRWPRERGRFIEILQLMHGCGLAPADMYDVARVDEENRGAVWRLAQLDCVFRRYDA